MSNSCTGLPLPARQAYLNDMNHIPGMIQIHGGRMGRIGSLGRPSLAERLIKYIRDQNVDQIATIPGGSTSSHKAIP